MHLSCSQGGHTQTTCGNIFPGGSGNIGNQKDYSVCRCRKVFIVAIDLIEQIVQNVEQNVVDCNRIERFSMLHILSILLFSMVHPKALVSQIHSPHLTFSTSSSSQCSTSYIITAFWPSCSLGQHVSEINIKNDFLSRSWECNRTSLFFLNRKWTKTKMEQLPQMNSLRAARR